VRDIGASESVLVVRLPHPMTTLYAPGLTQRNCARLLLNAFGGIANALAVANARKCFGFLPIKFRCN